MTNNCHLKNISVERQRYKTYNNDVTYNKALDHIYHLINKNFAQFTLPSDYRQLSTGI